MSSNSEARIVLHTEDAFIPAPPDYLGLLCLRNPDGATTELTQADLSALDDEDIAELRRPQFVLEPDESNTIAVDGAVAPPRSREGECRLFIDTHMRPALTPVLHGSRERPTIYYDPYFARECPNPRARQALARLADVLEVNITRIALAPGDFLWFDNRRVVHGRSPFCARFDGRDRWLKRIRVTRDSRKLTEPRPYTYL
jgi:hypothetical protein